MRDIELNQQEYDELVDLLNGFGSYSMHPRYSGRGMYGKQCLGVSTECGNPTIITMALARIVLKQNDDLQPGEQVYLTDVINAVDEIGTPATDGMGYATVYYWSKIRVADGVVDQDDATYDEDADRYV